MIVDLPSDSPQPHLVAAVLQTGVKHSELRYAQYPVPIKDVSLSADLNPDFSSSQLLQLVHIELAKHLVNILASFCCLWINSSDFEGVTPQEDIQCDLIEDLQVLSNSPLEVQVIGLWNSTGRWYVCATLPQVKPQIMRAMKFPNWNTSEVLVHVVVSYRV